ncbi:Vts1p SCDLUD_003349 [Saccharomycodes ludwigii]|uniref:Vts1p n=1 Tax=Saccharomycodes ludwigii TaxID=36035 RepID=UPI001E83CBB0|nr:hypothetical protein SCDLUD_003349 [Saccharomycodes ludwigii]KAH3900374.1 hypothetical protein SCDLUD_003349 [Saccharomycodes ludwigii]
MTPTSPKRQLSPRAYPGAVLLSPKLSNTIKGENSPIPVINSGSAASNYLDSYGLDSPTPINFTAMNVPEKLSNKNVENINNNTGFTLDCNNMVNFTQDVNQLVYWLNELTVSQQNTVMDNLLSSLREEVLQYTKWKLDSLINSGYISPSPVASPIPQQQQANMVMNTMDEVLNGFSPLESTLSAPATGGGNCNNAGGYLDSVIVTGSNVNDDQVHESHNLEEDANKTYLLNRQDYSNNNNLAIPNRISSPQPSIYEYMLSPRPKSADPYRKETFKNVVASGDTNGNDGNTLTHDNNEGNKTNNDTNVKTTVTNNVLNNTTVNNNSNMNKYSMRIMGSNGSNSNYKKYNGIKYLSANDNNSNTSYYTGNNTNANNQHYHNGQYHNYTSVNGNYKNHGGGNKISHKNHNMISNNATVQTTATSNNATNTNTNTENFTIPANNSMDPVLLTDLKLLNNFPAWLKSLRLHKYTDVLKDVPWQELIYYDDPQLETIGVTALGARRKLLKAFNIVKEYKEQGLIQ